MNSVYNPDRKTDRKYGIDLLRIVSMIMIPILHILGHGGILKNVTPLTVHYLLVWFLEVLSYCAVDVFALISGYVGYGRKFNYSNIIYYCLQVMFYTITITCIVLIVQPQIINLKEIIRAVFPFIYNVYWYFTAYFCLMFFIPLINILTNRAERKEFNKALILFFILFSLVPTLFHADPAIIKGGYSFLWIAVLYIVGSYIRKYNLDTIFAPKKALICFMVCCLITYSSKLFIEYITIIIVGKPIFGDVLLSYISPTIVLAAVFLVIGCSNLKVNDITQKFLRIFAPASFGVYLFHEEPLIRKLFITKKFEYLLNYNPLVTCLLVLSIALFIWLLGSLIDIARKYTFDKLKVKQHSSLVISYCIDKINIALSKN